MLSEIALGLSPGASLELHANFQSFQMFQFHNEPLQKLVLLECAPSGQVISSISILAQALHSLEQTVRERNEQIERLGALKDKLKLIDFFKRYFGLECDDGTIDARLRNSIDHIETLVDDCIHYSLFTANKLNSQAKELAKASRSKDTKPISFSFKDEEVQKFLPNQEKYPDFPI